MPDIAIRSLDGATFNGYAAHPKADSAPGIVVIHGIFGVNVTMRRVCDSLAAQGYLALCPDLFWRQEPHVSLAEQSQADLDRALALYKNFDVEASVRDLLATLAHMRQMRGCNGKVGAVGYCLGGKLAWILSSRSDVDCVAVYYGVGLENLLDEIHEIRMPVLLHIAEKDKFVAPAAQQKILAALKRNSAIAAITYPDAQHAFAHPGGQTFHPQAAVLADNRTAEFLGDCLKR